MVIVLLLRTLRLFNLVSTTVPLTNPAFTINGHSRLGIATFLLAVPRSPSNMTNRPRAYGA